MITSYQLPEGPCTARLYTKRYRISHKVMTNQITWGSGGMVESWEGSDLVLWR